MRAFHMAGIRRTGLGILLLILLGGCVSITSEKLQERQAALAKIHNEKQLFSAILTTQYPDIRTAAVKRISDETLLKALFNSLKLDEEIRFSALKKIGDQPFLKSVILNPVCSTSMTHEAAARLTDDRLWKEVLLASQDNWILGKGVSRVSDEEILKKVALRRDHVQDEIRLACIQKIKEDQPFLQEVCLNHHSKPLFAIAAVQNVKSPQILVSVAADPGYAETLRRSAVGRLNEETFYRQIYQTGKDELAAAFCEGKIQKEFFLSPEIREKSLQYFRATKSGKLLNSLLMRLADNAGLEKMSDQLRIAKALAAGDRPEVRAKCAEILFEPAAIRILALEMEGENEPLAIWALDLAPDEKILMEAAMKSKHVLVQTHAVMRITNESTLAKLAIKGPSRPTRISALMGLTSQSEKTIIKLAEDNDHVIAAAAVKKLKNMGFSHFKDFEERLVKQKEEEERCHKAEMERQAKEDANAEKKLVMRCRRIRGDSQLKSHRAFIRLKTQIDIQPKNFEFSGFIRKIQDGRCRLEIEVPTSGGNIRVSARMISAIRPEMKIGDYVTVAGICRTADTDIQLTDATVSFNDDEK